MKRYDLTTYIIATAHLPGFKPEDINRIFKMCHDFTKPDSENEDEPSNLFELPKHYEDFFYSLFSAEHDASYFGFNDKQFDIIKNISQKMIIYSEVTSKLASYGIRTIPYFDDNYPFRMNDVLKENDKPSIFYTKGNYRLLNQDCVAIVGARESSTISLKFTKTITHKLISENKVIVSGFARGVDRTALHEALKNNGKSIIVLPQGILTFTREIEEYNDYIINGQLLIISTFYPEANWKSRYAITRNHHIYNLSDAIYIPESGHKGGTFSGARYGLRNRKDIFVRLADKNEDNANNTLIIDGCIPLDPEGNITEIPELKEFYDKVDSELSKQPLTIRELKKKIDFQDDIKSLTKIISRKKKYSIIEHDNQKYLIIINITPTFEELQIELEKDVKKLLSEKPMTSAKIKTLLNMEISTKKFTIKLIEMDFIEVDSEKTPNLFKLRNLDYNNKSLFDL